MQDASVIKKVLNAMKNERKRTSARTLMASPEDLYELYNKLQFSDRLKIGICRGKNLSIRSQIDQTLVQL